MSRPAVDLGRFQSMLPLRHKLLRLIWGIVWLLFFRSSLRNMFGWRRWLLRLFGARVADGVRIYNSARIYYPPNLTLEKNAIIGDFVDCYCVNKITILADAMVSQYSFLCTASHDYHQSNLPLISAPIEIGSQAWICADVYIGPGVIVGDGAMIGARSSVFKNVLPWTINVGSPSRVIGPRKIMNTSETANAMPMIQARTVT